MNSIFSTPDSFALRGISLLAQAADAVMPMNAAQRRDLPAACRDLSAMLTTERGALSRSYWSSPRLTSAYLRYFLPWNIVRLTALLPSLPLGRMPDKPLVLDMGSGPFTLPIALWLSRPDLRRSPVTIVASDTSPHILELGRSLFDFLRTQLDAECPWVIRVMRSPAALALRRLRARPGELWLACMANVLNEMDERKLRPGQSVSARMRALLEDAHAMLAEGGHLLSIEPGTRQGGRLVAHLRKSALGGEEDEELDDLTAFAAQEEKASVLPIQDDEDDDFDFALPPLFKPVLPCVHAEACPMLGRGVSAWCHFNAPAPHAPDFLHSLSARAGLDKDSVSLSFLLLKRAEGEMPPFRLKRGGAIPARVVSDAFAVPGLSRTARYACTPAGLALLPDALRIEQGELCRVKPAGERDRKSHAQIMVPEQIVSSSREGVRRRSSERTPGKISPREPDGGYRHKAARHEKAGERGSVRGDLFGDEKRRGR
ncbi:MAG: hypothetical protein J6I40_04795 [Mailhella sp.]|nr:hypothetical protein [Mailhella sp.]